MSEDLNLADLIRDIPDFPKPGIVFKDITPLLQDPAALRSVIQLMAASIQGEEIDSIIGIESRGFIFGAPLAYELGIAYLPVRKPGKLPYITRSASYSLEYGEDSLEIHEDAISEGDRIVVVDDLLATGGTAGATCGLVEGLGGVIVTCAFLIELSFLNGREKLGDREVLSLIEY